MTKKLTDNKQFIPCCYEDFSIEEKGLVVSISKALGNEARLEIYNFLMSMNACYTGKIVEHLPLAQSTVSQHLKVLQQAGIVIRTNEGTSTSYCVDRDMMQRYHQLIAKLI
jgi:ArsR family transcriptional regulator